MPMRKIVRRLFSSRSRHSKVEEEKIARLEEAERTLEGFQARAVKVTKALDDRRKRNHWRESIEQMIQGVN